MSLAKQVINGTGVIVVAGGSAKLLALATAPILTPILGPAVYGQAALVGTALALACILALLGIDMAYARFYLQEQENQREAVERFCWRFAAAGAVVVGLISWAGWYWLGARWLNENENVALYSVVAIVFSVAVVMTTTRVRLLGDYRRIAMALFVAAVVSAVVSVSLALFWRKDLWALLSGSLAASVTTLAILGLPSISLMLRRSKLGRNTKQAVVSLGLAGSITAPMYWVISSADRWFLSAFGETGEVGIYTLAASVAMIGLMLNSGLTLVWFPEASRLYGERGLDGLPALGRIWARLVAGLAVTWLAVAASGGEILRLLTAPDFHSGAQYIPWLAGGVFFYGLASLANTTLFLTARMRLAAFTWVVGSVVSVVLNLIFVPTFGALAAAVIQCLSYGFIAVAILIISHHRLPMSVPYVRLGIVLVITITFGILMVPKWVEHPLIGLSLKFPVGLLVVALIFRVIAPDWYLRLRSEVLRLVSEKRI